ncbi:MAG: YqeG family HAD IIIA-type phosphatase [Candidatus Saccharimonadales bacterium]
MKTIIEHYPSVLDIDFAAWHKQGITCVLFDVDSTLTPWLDTNVQPEIIAKLRHARQAGITHLGLATNSKHGERIERISKQIDANGYFMPQRLRERKPRPSLIHQAMERFSLLPEQIAMVGDKYSADIKAAKRAGIARAAWVDRLGNADHPYDRYLRRPVEKLIRRAQQAKTANRF